MRGDVREDCVELVALRGHLFAEFGEVGLDLLAAVVRLLGAGEKGLVLVGGDIAGLLQLGEVGLKLVVLACEPFALEACAAEAGLHFAKLVLEVGGAALALHAFVTLAGEVAAELV